jgi:hypothetical protein
VILKVPARPIGQFLIDLIADHPIGCREAPQNSRIQANALPNRRIRRPIARDSPIEPAPSNIARVVHPERKDVVEQVVDDLALDRNGVRRREGGTVNATGVWYSGAGIGTGQVQDRGSTLTVGTLTIAGGNVSGTGGYSGGAGIGSGSGDNAATSSVGNLAITGGNVTGTGGSYSVGIGAGYASSAGTTSRVGDLTITGGTVSGVGDDYGAGIGASRAENTGATSTVSKLTIAGGNVK